MAEDKTLRLIIGIILILIALPGFFMIMYMPGMGSMIGYGFGYGFMFPALAIDIAILILGIYLISKNLK